MCQRCIENNYLYPFWSDCDKRVLGDIPADIICVTGLNTALIYIILMAMLNTGTDLTLKGFWHHDKYYLIKEKYILTKINIGGFDNGTI